ncbi:MAG: DUF1552 domain-containing protein [Pirellulaceae bacterium]|nr:DUF1552 domain-containing protein [Pirellulaceae bacterium]
MQRPNPGRRFFLKAAGVSLALPALESVPKVVGAASVAAKQLSGTRRMVCVGNMLGFVPATFFPEQTGSNYTLPQVLKPLTSHQKDLSIISGLDHGVKGGHFAIHAFLSGVRSVDAKSMPEANITIDQRAAESIGGLTRFPSLTIGSEDGIHGGCQMCWTRSGTRIPPITGPKDLFRKLFVNEDEKDRLRSADQVELNSSILDAVRGDAKSLEKRLNPRDRQKLDEYFTSVRNVEMQLQLNKKWTNVLKPAPGMDEPENDEMVSDLPELYDLIALALQTDSTRIATLEIAGGFNSQALGFKKDYHALSHHGQVQESIDALIAIETYQTEQFARFLDKLKSIEVDESTLFDQTMVLLGSGMGNANSHTNTQLPVILAGGPFKHGQHLAFDPKSKTRPPLTNLFVSMLQQFGVETDAFATSTGTLRGLESKS